MIPPTWRRPHDFGLLITESKGSGLLILAWCNRYVDWRLEEDDKKPRRTADKPQRFQRYLG